MKKLTLVLYLVLLQAANLYSQDLILGIAKSENAGVFYLKAAYGMSYFQDSRQWNEPYFVPNSGILGYTQGRHQLEMGIEDYSYRAPILAGKENGENNGIVSGDVLYRSALNVPLSYAYGLYMGNKLRISIGLGVCWQKVHEWRSVGNSPKPWELDYYDVNYTALSLRNSFEFNYYLSKRIQPYITYNWMLPFYSNMPKDQFNSQAISLQSAINLGVRINLIQLKNP
ncbi:MAG: hypothetical protein EP332_06985 [Bacteroidetes bacterium]|nr:MAG: hypothetical protein EP332_06985 [Bacteroidota bacterium]